MTFDFCFFPSRVFFISIPLIPLFIFLNEHLLPILIKITYAIPMEKKLHCELYTKASIYDDDARNIIKHVHLLSWMETFITSSSSVVYLEMKYPPRIKWKKENCKIFLPKNIAQGWTNWKKEEDQEDWGEGVGWKLRPAGGEAGSFL